MTNSANSRALRYCHLINMHALHTEKVQITANSIVNHTATYIIGTKSELAVGSPRIQGGEKRDKTNKI